MKRSAEGRCERPLAPRRQPRGRRRGPPAVLSLLLSLALTLGACPARAQDDPLVLASALLERMNAAQRTLDYQGTLVYLMDNRLETLHLMHQVVQGRVHERLDALSGPPRTLARERDRVTCVMPDAQPISVERDGRRSLLKSTPIDPAVLGGRYRIEIPGAARVAGRDADVLTIRPRDNLRYGYRFHLDQATGLPLKSDLIDDQGEAIEQLLFTTIDFSSAAPAPFEDRTEDAPAGLPEAPADALPAPSGWRFDGRPAGFELAAHDVTEDGQGAPVEHFVFSDQLSSYSVYIEANAADGLRGGTRIGAVHAAGAVVEGHQVTAVGEVPAATVAAALAGVARTGQAAAQAR